ncbi:MAG: AI-2E family transporter [Saprospiraceae bacterium]
MFGLNLDQKSFVVRATYLLGLAALLVVVLQFGKSVFVPLVGAMLLAFLVLPVVNKLNTCCLPNWLSSLLSVLTVVVSGLVLFAFLWWQLLSFVDDMPAMQTAIEAKKRATFKYIEQEYHISRGDQRNWLEEKTEAFWNSASSDSLSIFSATGSAVATFLLIPICMFFLLLYREKFKQFLHLLNPDSHDKVLAVFRKISVVSQQYVRGVAIVIVILTVLNTIGFTLLHLKYALLLGFLAAVLNVIPYVGVLIGSLLPVVIALVTKDSPMYAVGAFGVCLFVQFLENNFITPKVVGSSVNLNPLASMLALLLGGLVWGVAGMVLAIPLAGIFKVVCDHVLPLKPYGFLIGEEQDASDLRTKTRRLIIWKN